MHEGLKKPYRGYYGHHKCLAGQLTHSYAPQIHQQDFRRTHIFGYANLVQENLHKPNRCQNSTILGKRKGPLSNDPSTCRFPRSKWRLLQPTPNAPPSYPNILPGENTAERECLRAEHKVLYVHWDKYVHTGRITVNIGAAVFNEWGDH